jgi:hypothetical protein
VRGRPKLGLIVIAGFIGTVFNIPLVFANSAESFLTIERANISIEDDNDLTAELMLEFQPMEPKEHLAMEFVQTMEMPY